MYIKDLSDATIEGLSAELTRRRTELVSAVAAERGYEELQRLLESVTAAEATVATVAYASRLLSRPGADNETVAVRLLFELAEGADDRWSGRGNDIKRAYFDAKGDATSRIVERLLKDSRLG